MTEASLYGKDGLFHQVVKQSAILNGRYVILPNGATDLNAGNILSGIELPKEKYPLVATLPPVSDVPQANDKWESFYFRMLFLCTSGYTGDNKIKYPDPLTNTSTHTVPMDWNDMKNLAFGFMKALESIQTRPASRGVWRLSQQTTWRITRVSNAGNEKTSGVLLQFGASLAIDCEFTDINIDAIVLPATEHAKHFH